MAVRRVGAQMTQGWKELHIPVYLYEEAATRLNGAISPRSVKANTKASRKLRDPDWSSGFRTERDERTVGATVTGARVFLIAYNVNLKTNDPKIAQKSPLRIAKAAKKKDANSEPVLDARGKGHHPGTLKAVKALACSWAHIAQVSINLVNFRSRRRTCI
jgi:glutamate formiminotransferase/formiminotetrahydrofolate cyclodeaminase